MRPVIAIHAGAGNLRVEDFTVQERQAYRTGLKTAVEAGFSVLQNRGSALDAVCAAVAALEDNPLFNAGRGAVYTHAGTHEMDACVMNGQTRAAGAVAGVSLVKHPVLAARAVMEKSEHVLIAGEGAENFARCSGVEMVESPEYFHTERRFKEWQRALAADGHFLSEDSLPVPDRKFGTVGAVACDAAGHLAAATSTGGMTNKLCGRVGDSPLVGAGTYADDATCAVSCTGHGEYFIRATAAVDVSHRMRYLKETLQRAAEGTIACVGELGGRGGLIAVDAQGNVTFSLNTPGMYRAMMNEETGARMAISADEPLTAEVVS